MGRNLLNFPDQVLILLCTVLSLVVEYAVHLRLVRQFSKPICSGCPKLHVSTGIFYEAFNIALTFIIFPFNYKDFCIWIIWLGYATTLRVQLVCAAHKGKAALFGECRFTEKQLMRFVNLLIFVTISMIVMLWLSMRYLQDFPSLRFTVLFDLLFLSISMLYCCFLLLGYIPAQGNLALISEFTSSFGKPESYYAFVSRIMQFAYAVLRIIQLIYLFQNLSTFVSISLVLMAVQITVPISSLMVHVEECFEEIEKLSHLDIVFPSFNHKGAPNNSSCSIKRDSKPELTSEGTSFSSCDESELACCCICLLEFSKGNVKSLSCGHCLHRECLISLLQSNSERMKAGPDYMIPHPFRLSKSLGVTPSRSSAATARILAMSTTTNEDVDANSGTGVSVNHGATANVITGAGTTTTGQISRNEPILTNHNLLVDLFERFQKSSTWRVLSRWWHSKFIAPNQVHQNQNLGSANHSSSSLGCDSTSGTGAHRNINVTRGNKRFHGIKAPDCIYFKCPMCRQLIDVDSGCIVVEHLEPKQVILQSAPVARPSRTRSIWNSLTSLITRSGSNRDAVSDSSRNSTGRTRSGGRAVNTNTAIPATEIREVLNPATTSTSTTATTGFVRPPLRRSARIQLNQEDDDEETYQPALDLRSFARVATATATSSTTASATALAARPTITSVTFQQLCEMFPEHDRDLIRRVHTRNRGNTDRCLNELFQL